MIRHILAAGSLLVSAPSLSQTTTQEELDNRYDRALAAGYKALFLCSAIANAERNGAQRTPESVAAWELTGIQAPLDKMVHDLPFAVQRFGSQPEWMAGRVMRVAVKWADDMPPRYASHRFPGGCTLHPIGADVTGIPFKDLHKSDAQENIDWLANGGPAPLPIDTNATSYGEGIRTTAAIVIKDGNPIWESYFGPYGPEVPQRTWSVAKSIAATIVGTAVQRGNVDATLPTEYAPWKGKPHSQHISTDVLLRMASGRYSDTPGNRTDPLYYGGSTVEETAAHWPLLHKPGTVFRYANNDTLMAIKVMEDSLKTHPPEEFFAQLGMRDTVAETDWRGDYILSSQVWSTARDLAKLGQLYLDDGVLPDGTRILPVGWGTYVSKPSGPQPEGSFGYGAGFWLLNKSEGIPADTFAAMGNRGQFIIIVPSLNVVIVRRGEDPAGSRFDIAAFTRDVLETIEE